MYIRPRRSSVGRFLVNIVVSVAILCATNLRAAAQDSAVCPEPETQAAVVQRAFDLLMDRFETALNSADLLQAGWQELATEAEAAAAPAPGTLLLADDRDADIATVHDAFVDYASALPCDATGTWNPAYALVRGMAGSVHERHTYFLDPPHYQESQDWSSGRVHYAGIGARFKGPGLTVIDVFDNTPAARAGLEPGDEILEIDGASVANGSASDGVRRLRGVEGTPVELLVRHAADESPRRLVLRREDVPLDFVVWRQLEDGIGYVRLRGFPDMSAADTFEQAVSHFHDQGARQLIVDLRGNPGGRLDVGARLLGDFLPAGATLFEQTRRDGEPEERTASGDARFMDLQLVILVDEETASMGEIFAAALHEHAAATLVGTTTAGRVAGGQLFPLGDGSAINVTAFEVRSANGAVLNDVGVAPDYAVVATWVPGSTRVDPVVAYADALLQVAH